MENTRRPHNPYSAESKKKAAAAKLKEQFLNVMNTGARIEAAKAAARSKRKAVRQQQTGAYQSVAVTTSDVATKIGARGPFQPTTLKLYDELLKIIKQEVGCEETGTHKFFGEWPKLFKLHPQIDPSTGPAAFYEVVMGVCRPLTAEDFACRPVMFWAPELRFPDYYPNKKPCCPFHPGETSCVTHNGWSNYFRRVYDEKGVSALTGREYLCKRQQALKQQAPSSKKADIQYLFNSYDAAVISQAPSYIQSYWRQHGYCLSGSSGIRWTLISQMRLQLAHGMSALGFIDGLDECYHQAHQALSKMWRSHCVLYYKHKDATRAIPCRSLFFPFDDPRSEFQVPSLGFVLQRTIEEIESKIPFYKHKLTMNGGNFLSGDHFLKIGKVVLIDNERGFVGLYTVMNDFGKILLWRFVQGTTLQEVEGALRGLNRRYKLHGFSGPVIFTTDRCCQERSFYEGTNNSGRTPIFHSFLPENNDNASEKPTTTTTTVVTKYLSLNRRPTRFSTEEVANATANDIILQCDSNNWKVVSLDSEWTRGGNYGPDIIQITTEGLDTYIFEKPPRASFPKGLIKLLESDTIQKVAATISADRTKLAEAGIKLAGEINLQAMAKERGVVELATVGLAAVFKALFNGELEKDKHIRVSRWDQRPLSEEQVTYAALDSYSQMLCYLKMRSMEYMDGKSTKAPTISELREGMPLLLYTRNMAAVVADGFFVGPAKIPNQIFRGQFGTDKNHMIIRVSNVRRPGAKIECLGGTTFDDLLEKEKSSLEQVPWPIKALRPLPSDKPAPSFTAPLQWREETQVQYDEPEPTDDTLAEEADGNDHMDFDDEPEHDEPDSHGNQPLHLDNGSPYFLGSRSHTKQDIEHIFIRFTRVLSKQHGAFGTFMSRLSDAFFVPNQSDIEFVKEALRVAGLSEEQINSKKWNYFKRRIRRTVPSPLELEKQFNRVVNLMAGLEDNKTGKALFGRKAWNLYKSTLTHIRKGCMSDIPELNYYVRIGEDSNGIPIFRCLRGTSALEGYHQKVRQLIRGFNVSPRFAIALLYEFIHRWNHDIDIRILGLPPRYTNFYDGWELEEDVEVACLWDENDAPPHPEIECTKDFAATGEDFGVVNDLHEEGAEHLRQELEKVVDAVKDGTLLMAEQEDESLEFQSLQGLTSSAAWVADKYGRRRGSKQVRTATEKDFFARHLASFQGKNEGEQQEPAEADNYTSIQWGRFASFWNNWVRDEDVGKRPMTDMTYKSQFMLMAYYKQWKQEGNAAATLLPISQANKELRRELRGPSRETRVSFEKDAPRVEKPLTRRSDIHEQPVDVGGPAAENNESPSISTHALAPTGKRVGVQTFTGRSAKGTDMLLCVEAPVVEAKPNKKRKRPRCRMCGHTTTSKIYAEHHEGGIFKKNKEGQITKRLPHEVCSVPQEKRKRHFPVAEGARVDLIPREEDSSSDEDNPKNK